MREKGIRLSLSIAEAILSSLTIVSLIYSIKTQYFMPSEAYRYDFVNAFTPLLFVLSYLTILVAMTSECVCFFYQSESKEDVPVFSSLPMVLVALPLLILGLFRFDESIPILFFGYCVASFAVGAMLSSEKGILNRIICVVLVVLLVVSSALSLMSLIKPLASSNHYVYSEGTDNGTLLTSSLILNIVFAASIVLGFVVLLLQKRRK